MPVLTHLFVPSGWGRTRISPPWSYNVPHFAETATRALEKVERGRVQWRIGAVNECVDGGLRQISVEGGAVMVNSVGSEMGASRSVLVKVKRDIVVWCTAMRLKDSSALCIGLKKIQDEITKLDGRFLSTCYRSVSE